ncbi:hypothetical protein RAB80_015116 [Fusarium oxysporum f. sp. vasinfectum]|uniref:Transmembrane protein n=1 Tax=Fusarium oxysporum f. sp. vasinfectum 25433 TaxID=1089449 RepID=X0L4V1_FUSOX|nr:hypothetical protein FOTG_11225 [Fusarium oxysporum f. sp. vasinfectum 25433]KAK2669590.1 hypothetical protein RAB80_015116 [Fusarium oxysporum f. sp. vasinfectum]KAK2925152.1 hypothetical protein FoTM2_015431 [Fusarium oxysporum f. sp. vasinfectum]
MADLFDPRTTKLASIVSLLWIISFTIYNFFKTSDIIFFSIILGTSFVLTAATCVCLSVLTVIAVYLSVLANAAILCIIVLLIPVLQYLIQCVSSVFTRIRNVCDRIIRCFDVVVSFLEKLGDAVQLFPEAFDRFLHRVGDLKPLVDE